MGNWTNRCYLLLCANIYLSDKPKIEGEEEDDELDEKVLSLEGESEDEKVESDESESEEAILGGEEGYEPDEGEDISKDDEPQTPESKQDTPTKGLFQFLILTWSQLIFFFSPSFFF